MEIELPDTLLSKETADPGAAPIIPVIPADPAPLEKTDPANPDPKTKEEPADKEPVGINLFDPDPAGAAGDPPAATEDTTLQELAEAFGLALPENTQKWEKDLLKNSLKNHIEETRVKPDFSGLDPEVKLLYEFVQENGGSLSGLMVDPVIRELNEYTLYNPEYAFRIDLASSFLKQGFSEEDAANMIQLRIDKIPKEEREAFFENYHKGVIKSEINPKIEERVKAMNEEKKSYQQRIKATLETDRQNIVNSMIKTVEQLETFVGLQVSQENKQAIVSKIRGGNIEKEIAKDPGKYQMMGYMLEAMGKNIVTVYRDLITNQANSQYFKGAMSTLDQLYNKQRTPADGENKSGILNDWSKLKV